MAKRRPRPPTTLSASESTAFSKEPLELDLETEGLLPLEITWLRRQGDRVKKGADLASVRCKHGKGPEVVRKLVAPRTGTLEEVLTPDLQSFAAAAAAAAGGAAAGTGEGPDDAPAPPPPSPPSRLLLGQVSYCTHPYLQSGRMCAICGEVLAEESAHTTATTRVFVKGGHHVSVSHTEAASLYRSMATKLMKDRKLNLILDIDLTLLHATIDPRAEQIKPPKGEDGEGEGEGEGGIEVHAFDIMNQGRLMRHWVALRPGLREFLKQAQTLYILTIYTHGRRDYAHEVAKVLDPDRSLFADRIVSRDDCPDLQGQKSLQRLFPGGIEMALILDDSPQVWQGEQSRHLLPVVPFKFYTGFEEFNKLPPALQAPAPAATAAAMPGTSSAGTVAAAATAAATVAAVPSSPAPTTGAPSPTPSPSPTSPPTTTTITATAITAPPTAAAGTEPADKDTQLSHTWRLLQQIHALYYDAAETTALEKEEAANTETHTPTHKPKNVAVCLATLRKQVLGEEVCVLFSGVLPRGVNPRRSDLGYMATALGARLCDSLVEETTHVVAENPNTEKVYHASRREGVWVVNKMWLQYSFFHCERKEEKAFPLVKGSAGGGGRGGGGGGEKGSGGAVVVVGDGSAGTGNGKEKGKEKEEGNQQQRAAKRLKGQDGDGDGGGEAAAADLLAAALEEELA